MVKHLVQTKLVIRCSSIRFGHASLKLHLHQTADQPTINADQFYGLVWYDRVENYPFWLKSVSIPDQHPLYPRFILDAPTLKSRSPRPTPVLPAVQSPLCTTNHDTTTLTTLNIGPTPDQVCLISTPGLKWIIQANVMPTDSFMTVQYPKCAYAPIWLRNCVYILVEVSLYIYNSSVLKQRFYICNIYKKTKRQKYWCSMQEKIRIFKSNWCYSRFLIHFLVTKSGLFVQKQDLVILIRSNPTYLRCIADQTRSKFKIR